MQNEQYKILVADVDLKYAKDVQATLTKHFRHVAVTDSGPHVLSLCAKTEYDLVIVNNRLPGMLGIEVVRRLEQKYEAMRRILVSDQDTDPVIESALEWGIIDRFLQKPIEPNALVWEVEYLLGLRLEAPPVNDESADDALESMGDEDAEAPVYAAKHHP